MSGETVTRIRATQTGVDRYGNPTTTDAELDIDGAFFAPEQKSSEPVEVGRSAVIVEPTLYFPGLWPDLTERDRVRVRSHEYEVDGVPADWRNPWGTSALGGLVVTLKRVEG